MVAFSLEKGPGLVPVKELDLLILVGLTGVGKSSLLEALALPALPDRRLLVDEYVLPRYGAKPPLPREERFRLTRRFREEFPGGVAEVLARGYAEPEAPLLFDGLRGEGEVAYALEHLPRARFLLLHARGITRLKRLLLRKDPFDRAEVRPEEREALASLAQGVLSEAELEEVLALAPPSEVLAKLKIVVEEGRNYDPEGPMRLLAQSPRALVLDTERLTLEEEVEAVRRFLR
ncbi:MAG: hypothetical protein ACUVQD_03820 [Thermaceae bacterium]